MWAYSFYFLHMCVYEHLCIRAFMSVVDDWITLIIWSNAWRKCGFIRTCCCSDFWFCTVCTFLWPVRFPVGDSVLGSKHYVAHGTDTAYTFGAFSCMDYSGSAESWAPTADEKRLSQRITSAYLPPELLQLTFVSVKVPFVVHLRWERRKAFVAVRASVGPVRNNATASVAILDHRNP